MFLHDVCVTIFVVLINWDATTTYVYYTLLPFQIDCNTINFKDLFV